MERNGKIFVLLSNLLLQQQLDFAQCDYYWSGTWIETARINNCARRKFERAFCIRMDFRWTVKAISIEVAIEALNINSTRGPVLNIREECPNLVRKKKKKKNRRNPDRNPEVVVGVGIARIGLEQRVEITGVPRRILKLPAINLRKPFGFPQSLKGVLKEGTKYIRFEPFLSDEIIKQTFLIFILRNYWNCYNVGIFTKRTNDPPDLS